MKKEYKRNIHHMKREMKEKDFLNTIIWRFQNQTINAIKFNNSIDESV